MDENKIDEIEAMMKTNDIFIVKFDNENSKYDNYINTLQVKVVNITDPDIIDFYDIDIIPSLALYKDKNLVEIINGFKPKTFVVNKLLNLMNK